MHIVITGASGFIGSHLVDRFLSEGARVTGIDSLITGKIENTAHMAGKDFRLIRADVVRDDFEKEIEGPVDGILHFASPASPVDFCRIPLEILEVNSIGTRRCLELAQKYQCRFIMASTSEIYGDPLEHPQKESYCGNVNPYSTRSVYNESKRFAESLVFAFHRKFNTDIGIVRIFNTYGPRMRPDDGRVVPNFIRLALEGKPLTICGDGTQTRSFCYVKDEVEGIYRLFRSKLTGPINIGNPDEFTMNELAGMLKKVMDRDLEVVYEPLPDDDPRKRCPDITQARELLGWEPEINLEQGLKLTLNWFKTILS